jgi:transposase InsO family protein
VSRFQFVADNSSTFEVKRLCELVEIERSSYYAWLKAAPARAARAAADAALAERIRAIHGADNTVGAPRVTAELNDGVPDGERVNHKRVARIMRGNGIAGYVKKRRLRTTIPEQADQKFPDLLKRDFTAHAPNRRYVGDITYLPLADGANLYLATVIDCYSRRLAGWAIADHMRTELVADALQAAAADRGQPDRGDLPLRSRVGRRNQPVVATPACWRKSRCSFIASAGVFHSSVLPGSAVERVSDGFEVFG